MKSRRSCGNAGQARQGIQACQARTRAGVRDPLVDTTPFGVDAPPPAAAAAPGSTEDGDAALFGLLWPLGESVKLDSTIDRRTLRAQIARLGELGYALDFKTQEWSRQAEPQAA